MKSELSMAPNDFFTPKNEAAGSSESFLLVYQSTRHHVRTDRKLVGYGNAERNVLYRNSFCSKD